MGSVCVKFHDDRCKGKVVMRTELFYLSAHLQKDGRTNRVIPVYPSNFVAGYNNHVFLNLFWIKIFIFKQLMSNNENLAKIWSKIFYFVFSTCSL